MQLTQQPGVSNFGAALRSLRERAALSQRGLARRSGLTPAYVSLLEGGRRMPERPTVERLAAALDLTSEDRGRLLLAAGYAAPAATVPAQTGPLAAAESVLDGADLTPDQRDVIAGLTALYVQGLTARIRAGRPLVSDLAAPWQQRILEALDEKMAEDFAAFRESYLRPLFDL
jgi:transcriptional regulator with XRE-family HTH domain